MCFETRVPGALELPPLRRVPRRPQEHRFLTGGEKCEASLEGISALRGGS